METTTPKASLNYLKTIRTAIEDLGHCMPPNYLRYFTDVLMSGRLIEFSYSVYGSLRVAGDPYLEWVFAPLLCRSVHTPWALAGMPRLGYKGVFEYRRKDALTYKGYWKS